MLNFSKSNSSTSLLYYEMLADHNSMLRDTCVNLWRPDVIQPLKIPKTPTGWKDSQKRLRRVRFNQKKISHSCIWTQIKHMMSVRVRADFTTEELFSASPPNCTTPPSQTNRHRDYIIMTHYNHRTFSYMWNRLHSYKWGISLPAFVCEEIPAFDSVTQYPAIKVMQLFTMI